MQFHKTYVAADWDNEDDVTPPIVCNWRGGPGALQITVTGTIDYDVEMTLGDIQFEDVSWFVDDEDTQSGVTDDLHIAINSMPKAIRIKVNSATEATITVDLVQSDD